MKMCIYISISADDYLYSYIIIPWNSIQDYFYSTFYDTTVAKQLHEKLSF